MELKASISTAPRPIMFRVGENTIVFHYRVCSQWKPDDPSIHALYVWKQLPISHSMVARPDGVRWNYTTRWVANYVEVVSLDKVLT